MNNQEKWDRRFLEMARMVAEWSKDPSTKVGCVLVNERREVVATGYNGFPPGIADDERLNDRATKYPRVVHAEMNSILQAGRASRGSVLYMFFPHGGTPCSNCTKHLITAGVRRIVFQAGPPTSNWAEDQQLAKGMLEEAGVELVELTS